MDDMFLKDLSKIRDIRIYQNVKIKSTINISAIFKYKIEIYSISRLKEISMLLKKYNINHYVLGNCSNVLFLKEYYDGAIISFRFNNSQKNIVSANESVIKLNNEYIKEGIDTLLFLTLVPASIGGAILMNASANNKEVKDIVEYVYFYDFELDKIRVFNKKECEFNYRDSYFKKHDTLIIGAKLKLTYKNKKDIDKEYKEIIEKRENKLPYEYPSLGSVFKNFNDISVGKLVDDLNMKGLRVNDMVISNKHANVIINLGFDNGKDMLDLINVIKDKVYKTYKRRLELEIILFE